MSSIDIRSFRRLTDEEITDLKKLFRERINTYNSSQMDSTLDAEDFSLETLKGNVYELSLAIPEGNMAMTTLELMLSEPSTEADPNPKLRAILGLLMMCARDWDSNQSTIRMARARQPTSDAMKQIVERCEEAKARLESTDRRIRISVGLTPQEPGAHDVDQADDEGPLNTQSSSLPYNRTQVSTGLTQHPGPGPWDRMSAPSGPSTARQPHDYPPAPTLPTPAQGKTVYDTHGQCFRVKNVDVATLNIPKVQFILLAFDKSIKRDVLGNDLDFQLDATLANIQEVMEMGTRSFFSTMHSSPNRRLRETLARRLLDFTGAPALLFEPKTGKNRHLEALLGQRGALRETNFNLAAFAPPECDLLQQIEGLETILWALTASSKFRDALLPFKTAYLDNSQGLRHSPDGLLLMTFTIQNVVFDFHRIMNQPLRHDHSGQPIALPNGLWTSWLTERCQMEIDYCWTRAFLVQDFLHLPWYSNRRTAAAPVTPNAKPTGQNPRDPDNPRPKKAKRDRNPSPATPKNVVTPAPPATPTTTPTPRAQSKKLCFRTVAIGLGLDTFSNDNKPNDAAKTLQSCATLRPNGGCPGDHSGWRSWTKAETRAAIVNLHDAKISQFLVDATHASFYRDLLAAVDNSTILA